MLTLEGLIAVIALCLTCFALGYTIGKDSTQKRRQDLVSLATFLTFNNNWATVTGSTPFMLK